MHAPSARSLPRCAGLACVIAAGLSALAAGAAWSPAGQPEADRPRTLATPGQPPVQPPGTAGAEGDWDARARAFSQWRWVTRPSRDSVMGFTLPIDVQEITVKAGEHVRRGQLLARGRDGEMLAGLEVQRTRAENSKDLDAARANLELADIRYAAGKKAFDEKGMSPAEMDERRLAAASARAQYESTQLRLKEQQQLLVQAEKQAERYRLEAPFDGIVDQIVVDVGTSVNEQQPVMRVVKIDPLWIDVPVGPAEPIRLGLKQDAPAWVLLDYPGETTPRQGRVLYVAPVVDAGGTLRVRVELPNPTGLPAGSRAAVRFSAPEPGASSAGGGRP